MEFGRLITAMVTPFDQQSKVDFTQVGILMDDLIEEQKSDSLIICGTTGESPTLTEEEKLELFHFAVKYARGRAKIIAGTGSNDTEESVQLSKKAEKIGVDGVLLVTPYYNRPTQEGMYQHYKKIAENIQIPIMLYNVPGRTGVNLSVEVTVLLSKIPNIVATKDCADLDQLTRIVAETSPDFRVYSGDDSQTLPALSIGAHGIVSVASHIIGKEMKTMMELYMTGETQAAANMHQALHPIFKGLFECPHRVPSPAPVKFALNMKGIQVGGVRLPLLDVNEDEGQFITNLIKKIKT